MTAQIGKEARRPAELGVHPGMMLPTLSHSPGTVPHSWPLSEPLLQRSKGPGDVQRETTYPLGGSGRTTIPKLQRG